ncbi:phage tail length tape measure family protein [Sphingopyxis indica]|uniref:Phage tail tape measure protein, lambda family n=1 Tax=Sphingopyxis indica TaxID=436663 RepID=A0A239KN61_9SPHN|nr:phage tail length tape measure family protein [Sphingopyxis indica]SNT19495.1 phage tail tape measure protein, lambda family [Sphingopyxis indica]
MDVAALSMSVDSSGVVKATADLDKFSASADKASAAASKVSGSGRTAKLGQDYERAARAADKASGSIMRIAQTAMKADAAMRAANDNTGRSFASASAHVEAYRKHLAALPTAANQAAAGIGRVSKAVATSAGAIKANTGNIAAQFQDIGVTAAMGMSPLMIALQQGTQLSAVFAASGQSAFKAIGSAIGQVINPTALLTIGLVAAAAALVQMVDWGKLAQSAMLGLADILETIAPYAVAAAGALALLYAPSIVTGIATVTKGFVGMAASMLALIPIPVLIVAGLTAITAAAVHWRDDLTRIFGTDIVAAAKSGINYIVGGFVGAYNAVRATWADLPAAIGDAAITAANRVIDATSGMVNRVKQELNDLFVLRDTETGKTRRLFNFDTRSSLGRIANPYAGSAARVGGVAADAIRSAQSVDYVGKGIDAARGLGRMGADALRGLAGSLGADGAAGKGDSAAGRAAAISEEARALQERNRATEAYIASLTDEVARIGLSDEALRKYEVTQALSRATTDKQREAIEKLSAKREEGLKVLRQQQEVEAAQKQLAAVRSNMVNGIDIELATMGMVGEQREREILRIQRQIEMTDLLTKIQKAEADGNVALADTYRQLAEAIDEKYAKQMRALSGRETIEQMRELNSIMTRGVESLNNGLVDAIMGTKSLGDVFKQVANQIIADLIRIAIRQLIVNTLMKALGLGGGGSFLSGLFADGGAFGTAQQYARGGAFDRAQRFANGSAFTNSVVSTPTLFKFANGSKFGEIGEAGPEAVMPLTRGPDGKLGVQSHGSGGSRPTIVFSPQIVNENKFEGAIGVDSLVAMNRQMGEMTKEQIRRELQSMLAQLDADGTLI